MDLLDPKIEERLVDHPDQLSHMISARSNLPEWVVIDEVQKSPKLLDVVHMEIESRKIKFALTGSSARKLKRGGANLLAGRAFLNYLFPLTHQELGTDFNLSNVLSYGTLPLVATTEDTLTKTEYLESYVQGYLKEEILQEQIIRNVTPFRKFLGIAAQSSGTLLNYKNIADDLGVDWATVRNYFEILEDTLLGFLLPPFATSLRKQQLQSSKFYLFDIGVKRVLDRTIQVPPVTGQQIGPLFEQLVICEIYRLNQYFRKRYALSHMATKGGLEIDLVVERPGLPTALVEIKSTSQVKDHHLRHLKSIMQDYPKHEAYCLSQDPIPRKVDSINILPWQEGIRRLGFSLD